MEAQGKHDFVPDNPSEEIAFKKGDKMLLLNYGDPVQWYQAQIGGQIGLVPGNYITIDQPKWYMGRISRSTAEQMLQGSLLDGAFLIRLSESSPTDFSLSVKCDSTVMHYRILKDTNGGGYYLWSTRFDSLNKLVDHYRNETVSRTHQIFLRDIEDHDHEFLAKALYDFEPDDMQDGVSELPFRKGDIIVVGDSGDTNWWGGRIGNSYGFFPASYVRRIDDK